MIKELRVPTGKIIITQGDKGLLETVSIGDYGKDKNIKANFLNLTREIESVPNGNVLPLSEKWVITLSTQYGCDMACKFCDVPKVGRGKNATQNDLDNQILTALKANQEVLETKRLNIHYARMGEPTWNTNVLHSVYNLKRLISPYLQADTIHPVISTMLPKNNRQLKNFLEYFTSLKNYTYKGEAGLQFSINSTDDEQRDDMFRSNSLSLKEISELGRILPAPLGRKYTLNFALADQYKIDPVKLKQLFDPKKFLVKITPIHETSTANLNSIGTDKGYLDYEPYRYIENSLLEQGFDVIVFIPSLEEDLSRITCGNAILSDKKMFA